MSSEPIPGGMMIVRPAPIEFRGGDDVGFSLLSDIHIGAPHVDYKRISNEVNQAVENGDRLNINGDLFDFILPSDRKRYCPTAVHPRLQGRRDVINEAVKWALEILSPAAHLIDFVGLGNHETAIEKHHSIDPTMMLVYELQKIATERDENHIVHYGGYTGFVDYRFHSHTKRQRSAGTTEDRKRVITVPNKSHRWVLYYHHGSGGGAPVTKGMIDFNRKDCFVDADLLWLGHKHNRWNATVERISCPQVGDDVQVKEVRHVMTGAYFKTYQGQSQESVKSHGRRTNYAADAGYATQGKGGARVVLTFPRDNRSGPAVRVIQ